MKILIFSVILTTCIIRVHGQSSTITTPTGIQIAVTIKLEFENIPNYRNSGMDYFAYYHQWWVDWLNVNSTRSDAKVLSDISRTYNCHAYAWHVSDGGNKVWLDAPGQEKYYDPSNNPTYVSTNDSIGRGKKIHYHSIDHSAITTDTLGMVISKWGPGPLILADKNFFPVMNDTGGIIYSPSYQKADYYKLCTIGATTVSKGTTASVSTPLNIANASYNWSGDGNYVCASGTTSTGSVTGLKTTSTYGDSARVDVSIYSPLSNTTIKGLRKVAVTGPPSNTPNISGPTLVCSSGGSFTLNYIPAGNTVKWESSSNLSTTDAYANPCNFVSTGNGYGWVKAKLCTPCITGRDSVQTSVWSGIPPKITISGPYTGYVYHTYTFYSYLDCNSPVSYQWILNPLNSNHLYNLGTYADVAFYNPGGYYQIIARAQNTCGYGEYDWHGISIYYSTNYSLSPNPASDNVTLAVTEADPEKATVVNTELTNYTISIYNFYGILQSNFKKTGKNFTLPVSNLKNGNYIVNITNGEDTKSLPLVVKH